MYQLNPLLIESYLIEGWKDQLIKDPGMIKREIDPVRRQALKLLRRRLINGRKVMPAKIKRDVVGYIPQDKPIIGTYKNAWKESLPHGWKKRAIRITKPDSIIHKLQWKGRGDKLTANDLVNRNLGKSINLDKKISKRKPGDLKAAFDESQWFKNYW